ncbi:hypothetical protein [Photorhabdus luminescens]|uniref:DUF2513 domain-containing protein n=1 Tax=Photorhabdus luminescens subsp. mexicana TaxID=2100167 RepID=A0A4R4IS47_PHOLU|nr:hypothetical protein [Photorhabdus luminescens]TDB43342.1 hypothetical protein C5468_23840 [Photorhabdus luminescens subsp. mexicana]
MDNYPRELQRELLELLADPEYDGFDVYEYRNFIDKFSSENILIANLEYLIGHGLITGRVSKKLVNPNSIKITSKGIDFLSDDGGLGAILNVTVVKFHDDTIEKIAQFIESSALPKQDKESFLKQLRTLPADGIKHLMTKLIDLGLAQGPAAFQLISSVIQS